MTAAPPLDPETLGPVVAADWFDSPPTDCWDHADVTADIRRVLD